MITTNFMPFYPDIDPGDVADDLTLMSVGRFSGHRPREQSAGDLVRIADPAAIGSSRSDGQLRQAVGNHGASAGARELERLSRRCRTRARSIVDLDSAGTPGGGVTTYRFRHRISASRCFTMGWSKRTGRRFIPSEREFTQVIDELKRVDHSKWQSDAASDRSKTTVGLLFDFEQLWWFTTLPQAKRWTRPRFLQLWYAAATRLGLDVRAFCVRSALGRRK